MSTTALLSRLKRYDSETPAADAFVKWSRHAVAVARGGSPVVVVIRGESGAGKTEAAQFLLDVFAAQELPAVNICADAFMGPVFDPARLGVVHAAAKCAAAAVPKSTILILSNTSTTAAEVYPEATAGRNLYTLVLTAAEQADIKRSARGVPPRAQGRHWENLHTAAVSTNALVLAPHVLPIMGDKRARFLQYAVKK